MKAPPQTTATMIMILIDEIDDEDAPEDSIWFDEGKFEL